MNREVYIKQLIKDAGLTIKDFTHKINMPYTTLLSILNGSIVGTAIDNVLKICKGLSRTVRAIAYGGDTPSSPKKRQRKQKNLLNH